MHKHVYTSPYITLDYTTLCLSPPPFSKQTVIPNSFLHNTMFNADPTSRQPLATTPFLHSPSLVTPSYTHCIKSNPTQTFSTQPFFCHTILHSLTHSIQQNLFIQSPLSAQAHVYTYAYTHTPFLLQTRLSYAHLFQSNPLYIQSFCRSVSTHPLLHSFFVCPLLHNTVSTQIILKTNSCQPTIFSLYTSFLHKPFLITTLV